MYRSVYWKVVGRHCKTADATEYWLVAIPFTRRANRYQLPPGNVADIVGSDWLGEIGTPLLGTCVNPSKYSWPGVGLENAEYHISATVTKLAVPT